MLRFILVCIFLLLIIVFLNDSRRGFYGYSKADIDLIRIPLIEPYEIVSADRDGESWGIMYDNPILSDDFATGMSVDSVGLKADMIIFYSRHTVTTGRMGAVWYVFNTHLKSGKLFTQEERYQQFLKTTYQGSSVKLYAPEMMWEKFKDNYELPAEWQPYIEADKKNRWWVF
jgi:hypothetical protein